MAHEASLFEPDTRGAATVQARSSFDPLHAGRSFRLGRVRARPSFDSRTLWEFLITAFQLVGQPVALTWQSLATTRSISARCRNTECWQVQTVDRDVVIEHFSPSWFHAFCWCAATQGVRKTHCAALTDRGFAGVAVRTDCMRSEVVKQQGLLKP